MKKICALLMVLLLLPVLACGEACTIGEVREQAEELGRWTRTYIDDYGREVPVDIAPIIPDVEAVPIWTIEKPEYTLEDVYRVCDPLESQVTRDEVATQIDYTNSDTHERWSVAIVSTALKNMSIQYENMETRVKESSSVLESFAGRSVRSDEVDRTKAYFDGYDLTVQGCMDMAGERLSQFFPEYDLDLDLMWVEIVPNTRPCYFCILRQKVDGIPILMSAVDPVDSLSDEDIPFKRPACWMGAEPLSRWGLFSMPAWAYIAYVDSGYQILFDPLKKAERLTEDVPLCGMEKVIESIEQRIDQGNIRKIHALRFGYCCYIGKQGETILYPVWEVECDYFFDPKEEARYNLQGMRADSSITTGLYYRTMIVNAQTGEFMDPIELKENLLDCPEIITWEDVQQ